MVVASRRSAAWVLVFAGALGAGPEEVLRLRCIKAGDVTGRRYGSDPAALAAVRRQNAESEFVVFFVHVFKAAGSSIRSLLRRYAEKCDRKWLCLIQCSEGGAPKRGILDCRVRDTVNLKRETVFGRAPSRVKLRRNPSATLVGAEAQIIGGHYYYGMHDILPPERRYAYVTVLREPVATWISGIRYHDKSLDAIDRVVAALRAALPPNPLKQKYANAITYLVPARQQHKQSATVKLELARTNLKRFVLVGLVEDWDVTIDMLQAILDADFVAPTLWESRKTMAKNPARARFHGRDVVDALRRYPDLWARVELYLEIENRLYADALIAHAASCLALLRDRCPLRGDTFIPFLNDTLLAPYFLHAALLDDIALALARRPAADAARVAGPPSAMANLAAASRDRPHRRPLPQGEREAR